MENNEIISKVFTWLCIGLLITFLSGYMLSTNYDLMYSVLSIGMVPIIVLELVIAFAFGLFIKKMSALLTKICYILYCFITGLTFSTIFITFEMSSVISIFMICSFIFGLLGLYGFFTKKDLSKFGIILLFVLIGTIVGQLFNFFLFKNVLVDTGFTIVGVLVFSLYIAYDINNIKYLAMNVDDDDKVAVYGAFQLYLDFINLFIRLLQLFGKRND